MPVHPLAEVFGFPIANSTKEAERLRRNRLVLQKSFFETLPEMPRVNRDEANLAWFLYGLKLDRNKNKYQLVNEEIVYTKFEPALKRIVDPEPGKIDNFIDVLQQKLDEKLEGNPPDAPTLSDTIIQ